MRAALSLFAILVVLAAASAARADNDDDKPQHKITQSVSYLMLEPMYATIMDGDRPAGMLLVAIGLDIPDPRLRAEAELAMPLLRDDYVRSLIAYAWTNIRVTQKPDVVAIADRLQRVTDRALHRKGARVLLAQVASRVTP